MALAFVLSTALWAPASAQEARREFRFFLKLFDLTITADSSRGVDLVATPATSTDLRVGKARPIWLRVHPDTLISWLNSASAAVKWIKPEGPKAATQWSPPLTDLFGKGRFVVGRERRNGEWRPLHWLSISDSAMAWEAELQAVELDSLFRVLFMAATQSRLRTGPSLKSGGDSLAPSVAGLRLGMPRSTIDSLFGKPDADNQIQEDIRSLYYRDRGLNLILDGPAGLAIIDLTSEASGTILGVGVGAPIGRPEEFWGPPTLRSAGSWYWRHSGWVIRLRADSTGKRVLLVGMGRTGSGRVRLLP